MRVSTLLRPAPKRPREEQFNTHTRENLGLIAEYLPRPGIGFTDDSVTIEEEDRMMNRAQKLRT